ncbi:MAG: hypothetical protein PHP52_07845 [Bacteroidales bacterium]|nr:hypothetical protein [Bacteroidales bacterium]MDD4216605.1 hypothetical protein [Bacteroidales bacterium]MDY0141500.1 hypothetical protein [Bacteroidales bacterium]
MMNKKIYNSLIYSFVTVMTICVVLSLLYLHNKSNNLLFRSAMTIIEAPSGQMQQYFPTDSTEFFEHLLSEIELSQYNEEIRSKYFTTDNYNHNMSIFISDVFKTMYESRADFVLSSLDVTDPFNYTNLKLKKDGTDDCSFNLVFIKENGKGKLFRIKNLHQFLNYYAEKLNQK